MDREPEIRQHVNGICKEMKLSIYIYQVYLR